MCSSEFVEIEVETKWINGVYTTIVRMQRFYLLAYRKVTSSKCSVHIPLSFSHQLRQNERSCDLG